MPMSEPPYGPDELRNPPLQGNKFIEFLHSEKVRKCPKRPPLYDLICEGKLSPESLRLWVKDMYSYWDHAMHYSTGAIFVKTNDEETRTHILKKLVDIEGKEVVNDLTGWTTPAYEELWLRFGEGLGLTRKEIQSWKPFTRTYYAIRTLCMLSRWWDWTWLDGIAGLYAGDLYGKENLSVVYGALKNKYGISDEALEFFRVYLGDLQEHIPWEEKTLSYWCCTKERQLTAAKAFRNRLDIENQLLVSAYRAVTSETIAPQVP